MFSFLTHEKASNVIQELRITTNKDDGHLVTKGTKQIRQKVKIRKFVS